jgi:REP element-mobilizing transposase RayT
MARPIRFIPPGSLVEVTTRTIQSRFLLRPSLEVNDTILGIIGRAQSLFHVRIHAFVMMSNHWHMLLSVDDACQLASFVAFVNGNIAREIGRLHDWSSRFWSRRYRAIVVADDVAAIARLRYIFQNGCKEGLVDSPTHWPGVSSVEALRSGRPLRGFWRDRTGEYLARRRRHGVAAGQLGTEYTIELSPLPCWRDRSESQRRQACAQLIADVEAETKVVRQQTGRPCLGSEWVCALNPHDRPEESASSIAPLVHASVECVKQAFLHAFAAFVDAYRNAAALLKMGKVAEFPVGAFPPRGPFVAERPTPA